MDASYKHPVVAVVGPTATGKTALGVALAEQFGGEVISADSMQIYKGLDVGTAKVTPEETHGIPHHGVDILEPDAPFSVADFTAMVGRLEQEIAGRGHLPILVGGTGLYVQSFLYGVRFTEEKMNLVYMGPMTERMQEQVIRKLMPLKEKIQKAIDDGTVFLFTGNALEIFGDYIENEDGSRVECLGLYRLYAKRDMMHRHNSDFEGEFDGNVIMGFKTQFTMAYTPDESHGLFVKNKGVGLNIKAKYEGIRVNNFFGTYLVGPILVLNPPFTKYILNLMGAGDVKLAFEAENMEAYEQRKKDFAEKVH